MQMLNRHQIALITGLLVFSLISGCTNWRQKYEYLNVEHENLKGRMQRSQDERTQLAQRISEDQRTIEELTRQIEELNRTPAEATGFGSDFDVAFDPSAGTITVTLPNTILFASGKAELKSTSNSQLDQILSVLNSQYAGKHIDVVGHTDTDPIKKSNWKDNWELSSERALSVTRYLIQHGVSDELIRASGCGPARPVASNSSAAGKAKNRRVEIIVYMK